MPHLAPPRRARSGPRATNSLPAGVGFITTNAYGSSPEKWPHGRVEKVADVSNGKAVVALVAPPRPGLQTMAELADATVDLAKRLSFGTFGERTVHTPDGGLALARDVILAASAAADAYVARRRALHRCGFDGTNSRGVLLSPAREGRGARLSYVMGPAHVPGREEAGAARRVCVVACLSGPAPCGSRICPREGVSRWRANIPSRCCPETR